MEDRQRKFLHKIALISSLRSWTKNSDIRIRLSDMPLPDGVAGGELELVRLARKAARIEVRTGRLPRQDECCEAASEAMQT